MTDKIILILNGQELDTKGLTLQLELASPLFDADVLQGSFSYPGVLPLSPTNRLALGFPDIIANVDALADVEYTDVVMKYGAITWLCTMKLSDPAITGKNINFQLKFASSAIAETLRETSLRDLFPQKQRFVERPMFTGLDILFHRDMMYTYTLNTNNTSLSPSDPMLGSDFFDNSHVYFTIYNPNFSIDNTTDYVNYFDGNNFVLMGRAFLTPFFYLIWVLNKLHLSLGYEATGDFLTDEEYQTLVIYTNYRLPNGYVKPFSGSGSGAIFTDAYIEVAKCLPQMKINEFFNALRKYFFIAMTWKLDSKKIEWNSLNSVIDDPETINWTNKAGQITEKNRLNPSGFTLKYPSGYIKDLSKINLIIKDPIPEFDDLPNPNEGEYYVAVSRGSASDRDVYKIYQAKINEPPEPSTWEFYDYYYPPYKVGTGKTDWQSACAPVKMEWIVLNELTGDAWLMPTSSASANEEMTELQLLFYRGMNETTGGTPYPYASNNTNVPQGSYIGNYSLRFEKNEGIYLQRAKKWLDFLKNAKTITLPVTLSDIDLQNLDWKRKVRIDNQNYLVSKISIQLPIVQAAKVELYSCS